MPRTKPRAAAVATSSRAMEADHQTEELSIRRGCDGINDALNRLNDRHHTGRNSAGKQTDRKHDHQPDNGGLVATENELMNPK